MFRASGKLVVLDNVSVEIWWEDSADLRGGTGEFELDSGSKTSKFYYD
jgi:hypothetical protein